MEKPFWGTLGHVKGALSMSGMLFQCYPLSNWQVSMLGEEARPLSVVLWEVFARWVRSSALFRDVWWFDCEKKRPFTDSLKSSPLSWPCRSLARSLRIFHAQLWLWENSVGSTGIHGVCCHCGCGCNTANWSPLFGEMFGFVSYFLPCFAPFFAHGCPAWILMGMETDYNREPVVVVP